MRPRTERGNSENQNDNWYEFHDVFSTDSDKKLMEISSNSKDDVLHKDYTKKD